MFADACFVGHKNCLKQTCVGLLLFALSLNAQSQSKFSSESLLVLSSKDINQFVFKNDGQWSGQYSENLEDLIIEKPYYTEAKGMSVDSTYSIQVQYNEKDPLNYPFTANFNQLVLDISDIETNDVVEKRVGSIFLKVYIKGQCKNFEARMVSPLNIGGSIQLDSSAGKIDLNLSTLTIQQLPEWEFSVGECSGIEEYEDTLLSSIKDEVTNMDSFKQKLSELIQTRLDEIRTQLENSLFKPISMNIAENVDAMYMPYQIEFQENGDAYVQSQFELNLYNSRNPVNMQNIPFSNPIGEPDGQTRMIFPRAMMQSLLDFFYSNGAMYTRVESSKQEGLKSLFNSRFLQFFLWSDLLNFKKKSNFIFDIYSSQRPNLYATSATSYGDLKLKVKTQLRTHSYAPIEGQYMAYANFNTNFKGTLLLSPKVDSINIEFDKAKFKSSYSWHPDYLVYRDPRGRISTGTLDDGMKDALKKEKIDVPFAPIDLGPSGLLYLKSFNVFNGQIEFMFNGTKTDTPVLAPRDHFYCRPQVGSFYRPQSC